MIEVSWIAAFGAGLVTFLAPCTFTTLPAFISYLLIKSTGEADTRKSSRWSLFFGGLSYVLGFIVVFTLLGLTATSLGFYFAVNKVLLTQIGGVVIIFFGLFILFGERLKFMSFMFREQKFDLSQSHQKLEKGYSFPFFIGVTSAFAWTPCIGPILGSILFLASSTSSQIWEGAWLLFLYGLGIFYTVLDNCSNNFLLRKVCKKTHEIHSYHPQN